MLNQPHIFTPQNNTLEERIRSYKAVLQAYRNIKVSLDHMNNEDWLNRLGTPEELQEAQIIVNNSLKLAFTSLQSSEIQKAEREGHLNSQDLVLIKQIKQQYEI